MFYVSNSILYSSSCSCKDLAREGYGSIGRSTISMEQLNFHSSVDHDFVLLTTGVSYHKKGIIYGNNMFIML